MEGVAADRHGEELEVWSGLHTLVGRRSRIGPLAKARGVRHPRRAPPAAQSADRRRPRAEVDALVVLAVGSDCNVGKMTAQCSCGTRW